MSDRLAYTTALAAFAGALNPVSFPGALPLALVLAIYALIRPRAPVLVVGVGLLCAVLAARSWDGLDTPSPHTVEGTATLVGDPERRGASTTALLRVDGRRYLASGWGGSGFQLSQANAGDRLEVQGTTSRYEGPSERQAAYHASSKMSLRTASEPRSGAFHWRAANRLRDLISRGADSLSPEHHSLYTGLVYGDDRNQADLTAADFRVAGLTHLLAVSGQNVAYMLALLQPLVSRLPTRSRWAVGAVALLLFATATRFEPSVLRATAMALLALTGRAPRPRGVHNALASTRYHRIVGGRPAFGRDRRFSPICSSHGWDRGGSGPTRTASAGPDGSPQGARGDRLGSARGRAAPHHHLRSSIAGLGAGQCRRCARSGPRHDVGHDRRHCRWAGWRSLGLGAARPNNSTLVVA